MSFWGIEIIIRRVNLIIELGGLYGLPISYVSRNIGICIPCWIKLTNEVLQWREEINYLLCYFYKWINSSSFNSDRVVRPSLECILFTVELHFVVAWLNFNYWIVTIISNLQCTIPFNCISPRLLVLSLRRFNWFPDKGSNRDMNSIRRQSLQVLLLVHKRIANSIDFVISFNFNSVVARNNNNCYWSVQFNWIILLSISIDRVDTSNTSLYFDSHLVLNC